MRKKSIDKIGNYPLHNPLPNHRIFNCHRLHLLHARQNKALVIQSPHPLVDVPLPARRLVVVTAIRVALQTEQDLDVDAEDGPGVGADAAGNVALDGRGALELGRQEGDADLVAFSEDARLGLGGDEGVGAEDGCEGAGAGGLGLLGGDLPAAGLRC